MTLARIGSEFLVNSTTLFNQQVSSVATLSDGRFIVTWEDQSEIGSPNIGFDIRGRIFAADGSSPGGEFVVNTTITYGQTLGAVSALTAGSFVVTWTDSSVTGGDTSASAIRGQVFDAVGSKTGNEFLVNSTAFGAQFDSAVTSLANGNFAVSWTDRSDLVGDVSLAAVRGQLFTAGGAKIGSEFLINTTTADLQFDSSIDALSDGRFVVTWTDRSATGGDTSADAIRGQIFTADGIKSGSEFLVNSPVTGVQNENVILALPNGGFTVAWTDASSGTSTSIRGQQFDLAGSKVGASFQINSSTFDGAS